MTQRPTPTDPTSEGLHPPAPAPALVAWPPAPPAPGSDLHARFVDVLGVALEPAPAPGAGARRRPVVAALEDGRRCPIDRIVTFGRDPAPGPSSLAVTILDDDQVSREHLTLQPGPRGTEAIDQGSTNGTRVERAGSVVALEPKVPFALGVGDIIHLGRQSRVRIEVGP